MTNSEPRTAKATKTVIRRGQETKAAALREAGWLVLPPERATELRDLCASRMVEAASGGEVDGDSIWPSEILAILDDRNPAIDQKTG